MIKRDSEGRACLMIKGNGVTITCYSDVVHFYPQLSSPGSDTAQRQLGKKG